MAEPFRIKIDLPNATGVLGDTNGYLIANEAQLRVAQRNVGVGYITLVQARVFNDTTWTTLATLTGDVLSSAIDISAYDLLRFNVNTAGSTGDLYISSFFPKALSVGGGGNSFETIQTDAGTNPVASSSSDTLTLTSSDGSITITGNSGTDTINLISNISGAIGTEAVQDIVGAMATDTATIDFTYTDASGLLTADVKPTSITSAMLAGSIDATKIADGSVTNTEFQYINTLTSNAQTQLNNVSVANAVAHSTGIITGGILSIGSPTTTFSITDGTGMVVDNTVTPATVTQVSWSGKTNIAATYVAAGLISFVAIDNTGTVVQQLAAFTNTQHRQYITIGSIVHVNLTNLDAVNQFGEIAVSPANQLSDISEALGKFNISGNIFSANGANLNINKSLGKVHSQGSNWGLNTADPNVVSLASLTALSFQYRFQTGTNGATGIAINPNIYDLAGVSTAVTSNKFTIQRIYSFVSNNVKIQPGQTLYGSLSDAKAALQSEVFVTEPSISTNGILRAFLIVKEGTTNLQTATNAFFYEAGKFSGQIGIGGQSVSSLQNAYDNSTDPEILTDSTRGALTLRRGSGADTDNILEGLSGAGATTFTLKGNGAITASGNITGSNLSGTNTGDNATNTQYSGLVTNATHTGDATGATALTVVRINGTLMSGLATGILKNTTGTGVPSIAVNSDLPAMSATVGGAVPTPPNNTTTFLRGDGTFAIPPGGGGGNSFETIAIAGQSNVVADSSTDTLTLVAGTNITLTTNATTDTITIAASGGSGTSIGISFNMANSFYVI